MGILRDIREWLFGRGNDYPLPTKHQEPRVNPPRSWGTKPAQPAKPLPGPFPPSHWADSEARKDDDGLKHTLAEGMDTPAQDPPKTDKHGGGYSGD